jgi:crossover junction endodeoxyribonuclease RuvC
MACPAALADSAQSAFPRLQFCHTGGVAFSAQQFKQMQDRVLSTRRKAAPTPHATSATSHKIFLGVDPSLRGTGYGVISVDRRQPTVLTHGTVKCPANWERSRCLVRIAQTLRDVIREHHPTVCVIEGLFYAQNLQTALIMGEARGAALCAVAEAGLDVFEIAPRKVKQAIVGFGGAQKLAVSKMVQRMLNLKEPPAPDAADALALALAHVQSAGRIVLTPPRRI